jgi:RNA polymerase sigma-70 factor (ECF subfamily)
VRPFFNHPSKYGHRLSEDPMVNPLRRPETEADRRHADACRAGNREALDRFFREHAGRVERVISRLIGPTPDLEDLVQATFIEAIRSFPAYRGEASVASWVTRIAIHVSYHHLRKGVRRFVPLEVLPADSEEERGHVPAPDGELDTRRVTARLHGLLDRIKPKKRIAFVLYAIEGYTVEEIAAYTGASSTAVKSQLFFARRELQALVKADPVLAERAAALLGGGVA